MPARIWLAGFIVATAVLVGWPPARRPGPLRAVRRRLARLRAPAARVRRVPDLARVGAAAAGMAVAVLAGGWLGIVLGAAAAIGAHHALRRVEPASARSERVSAERDLPLAADLLAAGLRSGAPVDGVVGAVADALGGPLGERLARVARALRLGAGPAEGWAHLGALAGADRMTRAAVRSSTSGGALAGALSRLADDLRADRGAAAEAAARRAGVLIVLPLGLCFLPAFLLAGLVPVIVAVLGDVL
ncbi:MAG TPA: type II secretion system F family protein [Micromonosporaceae bacterium]|jgi:Flp pilus assembly protein TadB